MTGSIHDARLQARAAVARAPQQPMAWIVLAEAELDAGDAAAGEAAARRALQLAPGHPEALARLGRACWMQQRLHEAAVHLQQAVRAAPGHPGIALWFGHVLEDIGDGEAAAQAYAHAHALAPHEAQFAAHLLAWRRRLCDWRDLEALSAQVRQAVRDGTASVEPFAFLAEDSTAAEQLRCGQLRAQTIAQTARPLPATAPRDSGTALRLGFLSNGFGAHPTGLLTVALFEALRAFDDVHCHLFALSADDGSTIRRRLSIATTLHDVSALSHQAIAIGIRDAGIDILYDLRGWGGGGRPEVLAMRPAPVQVNWLAFPGTSGAAWMDHLLTDAFVLPADVDLPVSESVLRLPRCFQPSDTTRALPDPPSRRACGLPDTGVVFCCFNNSYKLNPRSLSRHLAVLRGVPGSVLWLLSGPGKADDRLRAVAQADGVDARRLVYMPKQPHAEYLARLQQADLFLDTNPYNAHTTASDALWAGCPVLTVPGDTIAARVAGSLNHHLGMPEMNMPDDAAFVAAAIALGNDPQRLRALRQRLAERRRDSGLFDMDAFAHDFVDAARTMRQA